MTSANGQRQIGDPSRRPENLAVRTAHRMNPQYVPPEHHTRPQIPI